MSGEQGPRVIRYVVQWRSGGRWALIDFEDEAAALAFAGGLAESGREPRVDGPMAWDDAPEEVRAAAWARVASADLADRAEELARVHGDNRALARTVLALRDHLRRVMGEPLREVISNG